MRAMGKRGTWALLAAGLALGGCVDEDVVFDDRPGFQDVAEDAGGFVGYADPSSEDKLTFCGACHGDLQAQWEETAHADAWAGLQSSDHAQAFCEACHTVNSLGNVAMESGGEATGGHVTAATEDGRYLDVQCESCHGPGLEHVSDPGVRNVPLAPIEVGEDLSFGCGECHQGTHHPFVEEWETSPHATIPSVRAGGPAECASCHSGEGALRERLGVRADYLNRDVLLDTDAFMPITCAVCHDPHSRENEAQLRFPVHTTDVEAHLCSQCHDRHTRPDTDGVQEYLLPHSAAPDLLAGTAGWFPPGSGLAPGQLVPTHASAERLCASCHVVAYTTTDEASGATFFSQGHTFRAAVCVDADGLPSGETGCELTADARNLEGCAECHGDEGAAAAALRGATARILPLARQLAGLLSRVDANGGGPGGPIDVDDLRFTTAEGALFNLSLALGGDGLPSDGDRAQRALAPNVTHNPALIEALLEASIAALQAEYGVDPGTAGEAGAGWWASVSGR